jgi:hypothetical protein
VPVDVPEDALYCRSVGPWLNCRPIQSGSCVPLTRRKDVGGPPEYGTSGALSNTGRGGRGMLPQ